MPTLIEDVLLNIFWKPNKMDATFFFFQKMYNHTKKMFILPHSYRSMHSAGVIHEYSMISVE